MLTDIELRLSIFLRGINDEFIKSEEGEIQLTNYGISGICIFNLSRFVSRSLNENKQVKINLNFLPIINNNNAQNRKLIKLLSKTKFSGLTTACCCST